MAGAGDIAGLAMSSNPYSGIAEMGVGAIKGITEAITASQQAKRADALREESKKVQTQQMRPEFKTALQNAQQQSTYGLPALQAYRDKIDTNMANNIRAIKESSPNGEATLAAISNNLSTANQAQNDLSAKDAAAQEAKGTTANNTLWRVGEQGRYLEDIRDKEKHSIQAQAGALENAATANKQTGINDALGGVEQGASQLLNNNPYDGSSTPVKQTTIPTLTNSGSTQIPSSGGVGSQGLGQLPYMPYGAGGKPTLAGGQDYTAGSYVPITPTGSNFNWSVYQ